MNNQAIITSCSNKFFPSVLNLIGSIRDFYPQMPIYVYDLGLSLIFRKELESMPGIIMRQIQPFASHWRSCYTWKSFIFANAEASSNLYIDAGNEVLRDLADIFKEIETNGYVAIKQGIAMRSVVPEDYVTLFDIPSKMLDEQVITAGVFGFRKDHQNIADVIQRLHAASIAGLCLGFSKTEQWKNKGVNKTGFVRNCDTFRHDTTLLSILLRKHVPGLITGNTEQYAGADGKHHPGQYIWNMRMNYARLEHVKKAHRLAKNRWASALNAAIVTSFIFLKNVRLRAKKRLSR